MSQNVLYFPYIRVPDNEWFTQVLLYWDQVGSIVPSEYVETPEKLGPHMKSLVQVGLVNQIFPGQYTDSIPRFTEAFLEYVDRPDFPVKPGAVNLPSNKKSRIHIEKLNRVADGLVERRLAKAVSYPWFDVESTVADQFMTYLASVLSEIEELRSTPITDQERSLVNFAAPSAARNDWRQKLDRLRPFILQDLLPVPAGGIDAEELARFKSDNLLALGEFRRKIESFLAEIVSVEDAGLAEQRIDLFKQQVQADIDGLVELMRASGWSKVGLGTLLALTAGGLGVADAIVTGGILSIVAAAFGIGAVIPDLAKAKKIDTGHRSYAAYAASAKKQFEA